MASGCTRITPGRNNTRYTLDRKLGRRQSRSEYCGEEKITCRWFDRIPRLGWGVVWTCSVNKKEKESPSEHTTAILTCGVLFSMPKQDDLAFLKAHVNELSPLFCGNPGTVSSWRNVRDKPKPLLRQEGLANDPSVCPVDAIPAEPGTRLHPPTRHLKSLASAVQRSGCV